MSGVGPYLHRLRYFVDDAWDEWRHSPGANLLALTALAASLFLGGSVLLVVANIDRQADEMRRDARVQVFLTDPVDVDRRTALAQELAAYPAIAGVTHIDKAEALRRYRTWAGEMGELAADLEMNPLPESFEVELVPGPDTLVAAQRVSERFSGQAGVAEVRFNRDWMARLEALLRMIHVGAVVAGAVVFVVVALVMAAVLRLAVHARRDEIEIMELVGATRSFVRGPFMVAGVVHGTLALVLAAVGIEAFRRAMLTWAESIGGAGLVGLLAGQPLGVRLTAALAAVGIVIALCGAYLAVRRPISD